MQRSRRHCFVLYILPVSKCISIIVTVLILYVSRARRNAQGHLEPDAPDDVVQASQGFADYELAPKAEDRREAGTA